MSRFKRTLKTVDYFDQEEDDDYGSALGVSVMPQSTFSHEEDEEEDPLDAFMRNNEAEVAKAATQIGTTVLPEIVSRSFSDEDEEYVDDNASNVNDEEYDSDGIPTARKEKAGIKALKTIDHSLIQYPSVRFDFYQESADIRALTPAALNSFLNELEIQVTGLDVPRPIQSFTQLSSTLPAKLIDAIHKSGIKNPTPIQAQALPVVLTGRDLIALAKTGSGKTFAYVWPLIVHVLDQPMMEKGQGPIGLILCPTRELCTQIFSAAKTYCQVFNIRVVAIYGGGGKYEMKVALAKEVPEIVVATPGRLMEMLTMGATDLKRVTLVVIDEAGLQYILYRMFELGFEYQIRSILASVRPIRQTVLFSATMRKRIESFAREILRNPLRIVVGQLNQSNPDIHQEAVVLPDVNAKYAWLLETLETYLSDGKILVFVNGKLDVEELNKKLNAFFQSRQLLVTLSCLHGDKDQNERSSIVRQFRKGEVQVLLATDVAARGLDVKDIRVVINYDAPKNIETYVHRIGRTGRMNISGLVPGIAYSLLLPSDGNFANELIRNLAQSNQKVTPELERLAKTGGYAERGPDRFGKGGIGVAGGPVAMTSAMLARGAPSSQSEKRKASYASELQTLSKGKDLAAVVENRITSHSATSSVIAGFVRASSNNYDAGSATESTDLPSVSTASKKKSRWDS